MSFPVFIQNRVSLAHHSTPDHQIPIPKSQLTQLLAMSPFELKDLLVKKTAHKKGKVLNAGMGNPNFFNAFVRRIFSKLQTAVTNHTPQINPDIAVYPTADQYDYRKILFQICQDWTTEEQNFFTRYLYFLDKRASDNSLTSQSVCYDLYISTLGCLYPSPPQRQLHLSLVAKQYLYQLMFRENTPRIHDNVYTPEDFTVFATEGAAAGILYVMNTLRNNFLLKKGDHIAMVTPIFSPYLEMPIMSSPGGYGLHIIPLHTSPHNNYQLTQESIQTLKNTQIKALFVVNPANPGSFCLSKQNVLDIGELVERYRNDLIILSDSVYAPYAEEYTSLMSVCPYNTIEIFSLSKYFGTTGWRLGLIAMCRKNRFSGLLNFLPESFKQHLDSRYNDATLTPRSLSLMERIVLDSRQVAEAHVGGLSPPQQTLMGMMLYYSLQDHTQSYQKKVKTLLLERMEALYSQLNTSYVISPQATYYYSLLSIPEITHNLFGAQARQYLVQKYHCLDFLFYLASRHQVVLLPGKGFGAGEWYVRVSLANLNKNDFYYISQCIKSSIQDLLKA